MITTAITILAALAAPQYQERTVQQAGRPPESTVQTGTPQKGRTIEGVPQVNPDGSPPRRTRWRTPVTVIYGTSGDDVVAYPGQFNLPLPAYGLVWRRIGNDAVLYDVARGSIVEVRQRWFG